MPPFRPLPALAALALVVAACTGGDGDGGLRDPNAGVESASPPSPTTVARPLPPATSPSCPTVPERASPLGDRPRYTLRVDVRTAERKVDGHVSVRFTPDLDTDRLVFRLWPNGPALADAGARLETGPLTVDGREAPASLEDPTTLVVRPEGGLRAGRTIEVAVPWILRLPGPSRDRVSVDGDAVRLGSFFPILSWEPGVGWSTEPSTGGFAEDSTSPTADFDLTVTVPPGTTALASGNPDRPGHWTATAVRDVALSVGRFALATETARAPHPVAVTVGVHQGMAESADAYRDRVVTVLEDFGRRFGPYPWESFSLALTPGLAGVGIEYPAHVMQGSRSLGSTTSHEVGHQWFYGLVGNRQGRDPWLDEGLASWAEARFERTLGRMRATVLPADARGHLTEPMTYWADHFLSYYEGVYVQGAQALDALGHPDLVDCALRVYVAQEAFGIARPRDLVDAAAAVFPDAGVTLGRFGVQG
ncbi:MAG TPA: M1 family aminopeptidase [Acidimicrobiales bacterium]|nr:M1 family aminopeptidase [Acidimicrobiales bacterium]